MGFGSFLKKELKEQLGSWDNFTDGFKEGFFGTDYLRDYKHASKTFVADGQALAPTNKFLFHVFFTLNTAEIPGLAQAIGGAEGKSRIGMLVKTAQLPSYTFDVEELHQYNRKRYVQRKINYQPVTLTLHDDGSDTVRSMWANYMMYYYSDSDYGYDGQGSNTPEYNTRDIYNELRRVNDWGYDGTGFGDGTKPPFFKDIKIYGLNRNNFTSYTLINPIIQSFQHDTFDYSAGNGIMQHSITFNYEAVKYGRGKVGSEVRGFGDPAMYDTTPSPLRAGTKATLFGQGGILDAGSSILDDLASGNILGAIRTGGSLRNTLKGVNIGSLVSTELVSGAISSGLNFLSNNGAKTSSPFSIPSFGSNFGLNIGGSIVNSAKGLFGGASFDSLSSTLSTNIGFGTNTFNNVSPSINALKEQFAPGTELNSDFTTLFASLKTAIEPGMNILETSVGGITESISTVNVPNITELVDEIPGADSLINSASEVASDISKSFAPVADEISNTFSSVANSNEFNTFSNNFKDVAGDIFSNGSNITQ
jgi:hypothetical protein